MKFQGLVFITLFSLSQTVLAQTGAEPGVVTLPQNSAAPESEAFSLPTPTQSFANVEAELQQFRHELRQFQAVREEVARDTISAATELDRSAVQQREELLQMMAKLANQSAARKAASARPTTQPNAEVPSPAQEESALEFLNEPETPATTDTLLQPAIPTTESILFDESVSPADSFSLGKVLFRTGDFAGAEKAFRKATVSPENEMTLQYLLATCMRQQSQWKDAMDAYGTVAKSNQDPVLRDLAKWQLENIRFQQQSETQLDQLKKQRQKRLDTKKSASTRMKRSQH